MIFLYFDVLFSFSCARCAVARSTLAPRLLPRLEQINLFKMNAVCASRLRLVYVRYRFSL